LQSGATRVASQDSSPTPNSNHSPSKSKNKAKNNKPEAAEPSREEVLSELIFKLLDLDPHELFYVTEIANNRLAALDFQEPPGYPQGDYAEDYYFEDKNPLRGESSSSSSNSKGKEKEKEKMGTKTEVNGRRK